MKQYYSERFQWIFKYTSRNFFYCLFKTLCIIVGLPIYAVMFAVEMVLTFVNMVFCWIPVLNVVVQVICKAIIFVTDKTFFICILPDIGKWCACHKQEPDYEITDAEQPTDDAGADDNSSNPDEGQ